MKMKLKFISQNSIAKSTNKAFCQTPPEKASSGSPAKRCAIFSMALM